jgi:hypothetical protein
LKIKKKHDFIFLNKIIFQTNIFWLVIRHVALTIQMPNLQKVTSTQ